MLHMRKGNMRAQLQYRNNGHITVKMEKQREEIDFLRRQVADLTYELQRQRTIRREEKRALQETQTQLDVQSSLEDMYAKRGLLRKLGDAGTLGRGDVPAGAWLRKTGHKDAEEPKEAHIAGQAKLAAAAELRAGKEKNRALKEEPEQMASHREVSERWDVTEQQAASLQHKQEMEIRSHAGTVNEDMMAAPESDAVAAQGQAQAEGERRRQASSCDREPPEEESPPELAQEARASKEKLPDNKTSVLERACHFLCSWKPQKAAKKSTKKQEEPGESPEPRPR